MAAWAVVGATCTIDGGSEPGSINRGVFKNIQDLKTIFLIFFHFTVFIPSPRLERGFRFFIP